ncbi:TIGR03619 family F420-dependent LLM class oxidoreductase [Nitrososphaera viennensis]|uniref:Luciferase-like monooxygenase family protein n=2 Tax=Nitrososphaera viennensis TaxID=1034015 RepID=A0A060HU45_9ARCH|nr:TIGR03619 family F420-dependent LLM class oxidoreductase [Nitrososphaera viennensis]AIC16632.1 luciferase-like monooxygenase family protein [Nitrososphaera viennensis EN76]UVS68558.1 TIGR03619 family F420-dependent LLM class oxidoreductase [Nitrososphaera viennensis]
MKAGIMLPHLGENVTRENVLYTAKEAEKEGLDSVWALERLLWPLKPQTPYVATPDGSLPAQYQNVLDPLETLTYLAGNTERISLGTSIIDMLFHNPVVLARRFATLDILSGGRAIAGFGLGWSKDEYDVSGVPFKHRGERADEFLQLLKQAWTEEVVQFKGKFYNVPASKIGPKPLQKPHPRIVLGGFSPNTFSRVIKYGDAWMPIAGFGPLDQIEQAMNGLREGARKANKDPSKISAVVLTYPNVIESGPSSSPGQQQQQRLPMSGTIDQIGSDIDRLKAIEGVDHIIFSHAFSPIGKDVKKMVELTKQLARFAR